MKTSIRFAAYGEGRPDSSPFCSQSVQRFPDLLWEVSAVLYTVFVKTEINRLKPINNMWGCALDPEDRDWLWTAPALDKHFEKRMTTMWF